MTAIDDLKHSYTIFEGNWLDSLNQRLNDQTISNQLESSYIRIASIQAWKSILVNHSPASALIYLDEAQNDLLASLILARLGSWRISLKSLRSALENIGKYIFYKDHPIEEKLSHAGSYKFSHSDYLKYVETFPFLIKPPGAIFPVQDLQKEYAVLSKAVHSSGHRFRMSTHGTLPQMWVNSTPDLNQWIDRERRVLSAINRIFLIFHNELIEGTKFPEQRIIISQTIHPLMHPIILSTYSVRF